jgi:hypothetical protein
MVESQLLSLISSLLKKAEEAGGMSPGNSSYEVSLEQHLERSRREKYTTRDKYQPTGTKEASDSLNMLRSLEREFQNLRPRLQLVNPTLTRFPHWIFGPLDLAQWLAFIGLHEERHLTQIKAIIVSPEFRGLDGQVPR